MRCLQPEIFIISSDTIVASLTALENASQKLRRRWVFDQHDYLVDVKCFFFAIFLWHMQTDMIRW